MRLFLTIITAGILALVPIQSESLERSIDGGKSGDLIKTCSDHASFAKGSSAKVKTEKEAGEKVHRKNRGLDDLELQKYVHQSIAAESLDNEPLTRRYVPVRVGPSTGLNWYRRRMHDSRRDFGGPKRRAMEIQESGTVKELDDDLESDPRSSFSSGAENNLREESGGESVAMERSLSTSEKPEVEVTGSEKSEGKISAPKMLSDVEKSLTVDFDASMIRARRKKGKKRPHYRPRPSPRPKPKSRNLEADEEHPAIDPRGFFTSGSESNVQEESSSDGQAMERSLNTSERQEAEVSETDEPRGGGLALKKLSDIEKALTMDLEDPAIRERRKKGKKRPHHRPRPRPKPKPESQSRNLENDDEHPDIDPRGSFSSGEIVAMERFLSTTENPEIEVQAGTKKLDGKKITPRTLGDAETLGTADFDESVMEATRKGWGFRPRLPRPRPMPRPRPIPRPQPMPRPRPMPRPNPKPPVKPRPAPAPGLKPRPKPNSRPNRRPKTNIESDTRLEIVASLDNLGSNLQALAPNYEENHYDVGNENEYMNSEHYSEAEHPVDEEIYEPEEAAVDEENLEVIPLPTKRDGGALTENPVARMVEQILGIDRAYNRRYTNQDSGNLHQSFMRRRSRPNSASLYLA